jgi:hypothetical protein
MSHSMMVIDGCQEGSSGGPWVGGPKRVASDRRRVSFHWIEGTPAIPPQEWSGDDVVSARWTFGRLARWESRATRFCRLMPGPEREKAIWWPHERMASPQEARGNRRSHRSQL